MFFWIIFFFFLSYIFFSLCVSDFSNHYPLIMVFGKKGSGKTTLLVKLALEHIKSGWNVYTNVGLPGTSSFNPLTIGKMSFPENSVVFIDEASISWDNRQFKNFSRETLEWFRYQRHAKVKVYLFSQTFDVDKKLRDLTDEMWLVEKKFTVFAWCRRIIKKVTLTEATEDKPSRIDESLKFDSILFAPLGSRMLVFLPRYSTLFDSFELKTYPLFPIRPVTSAPSVPRLSAVCLALSMNGLHKISKALKRLKPVIESFISVHKEAQHSLPSEMYNDDELSQSLDRTIDDFFDRPNE